MIDKEVPQRFRTSRAPKYLIFDHDAKDGFDVPTAIPCVKIILRSDLSFAKILSDHEIISLHIFLNPPICHENYQLLCRFFLKCQCDRVAQTFQAVNEVAGEVVLVELVQVKISQIVVRELLGKHVIDRHQNFVGDGHCRPLVPASGLETVKLVTQVGAFGFGRGISSFD